MKTEQPKITDAMAEWCRRLAQTRECKLLREPGRIKCVSKAGYITPSAAFVRQLELAGLILWRATMEQGFDEVAYLTKWGVEEAEKPR